MLSDRNRRLVAGDGFSWRASDIGEVCAMAEYPGLEQRVSKATFLISSHGLIPPVAGMVGMAQPVVGASHAVVQLYEEAHQLRPLAFCDRRLQDIDRFGDQSQPEKRLTQKQTGPYSHLGGNVRPGQKARHDASSIDRIALLQAVRRLDELELPGAA